MKAHRENPTHIYEGKYCYGPVSADVYLVLKNASAPTLDF
jgi:hypothetical protein